MINEHTTEWLGVPVTLFDKALAKKGVDDYRSRIYRMATEYDGAPFEEIFAAFTSKAECAQAPAIIIGACSSDGGQEMGGALELLVAARGKLTGLKGIFFGDIIVEESELSWIEQADVSPLFSAYPALEHFRVRGGNGLSLGSSPRHDKLKSLVVETGGLSADVIREIAGAYLPELENLEIWLGEENYGGDATLEDVLPLLEVGRFPKLKRLGICNAEFQDDIAKAVADSTVVEQLEVLSLALGNLSDEGAEALLGCSAIRRLKHLDLHHHYLSKDMMAQLKAALPSVDLSEAQTGDDDERYIAHSE